MSRNGSDWRFVHSSVGQLLFLLSFFFLNICYWFLVWVLIGRDRVEQPHWNGSEVALELLRQACLHLLWHVHLLFVGYKENAISWEPSGFVCFLIECVLRWTSGETALKLLWNCSAKRHLNISTLPTKKTQSALNYETALKRLWADLNRIKRRSWSVRTWLAFE